MKFSRPKAEDVLAGTAIGALGAFALWEATNYAFGTLRNMGPGYFPLALGFLLVISGLGIVAEGILSRGMDVSERPNLRGLLAITASLVAFIYLLPRVGLMPAIFVSVFAAGLAEREFRPVAMLVLALILASLCYVVFVWGLQMRLRPFWW